MRMKTIVAPSMPEAMKAVRAELGEDAVIISTQKVENGQGFRVVAAIDGESSPAGFEPLYSSKPPVPRDALEEVSSALERQGVPGGLAERLMRTASPYAEKLSRAASAMAVDAPVVTLAAALDALFAFKPLPQNESPRPLMFVGPPGGGKTIAVAKIAARAVLADRMVNIISCDTLRAGGVEQLQAFTRILDVELVTALDGGQLFQALRDIQQNNPGRLTLIDTAATNPLNADQLDDLAALIDAAGACDVVLVLPAGLDANEAAEMAATFAELGASRLLATRIDAARRYGTLLVAAEIGKFAFCELSNTATVADGLKPFNPVGLAQLLLKTRVPQPPKAAAPTPPPQAAPPPAPVEPRPPAPPPAAEPAEAEEDPLAISIRPGTRSVPPATARNAFAAAAALTESDEDDSPPPPPVEATPRAARAPAKPGTLTLDLDDIELPPPLPAPPPPRSGRARAPVPPPSPDEIAEAEKT